MISNSTRKDKRFMLEIDGKKIHFGSKNGFTFIDGATEKTKQNYLLRHSKLNEDWDKINAGSLSRWILWNKPSLTASIQDTQRRFGLKIRRGRQ